MPKWITGTDGSSRAKSLAMCGWTNRTIVARAERADPAIKNLEPPAEAPAPALRVQVKAAVASVRRCARQSHAPGSAYMNALACS